LKQEQKNEDKIVPPYLEITQDDINLLNLGPTNPIKFYYEIPLFEDELGDCGLT